MTVAEALARFDQMFVIHCSKSEYESAIRSALLDRFQQYDSRSHMYDRALCYLYELDTEHGVHDCRINTEAVRRLNLRHDLACQHDGVTSKKPSIPSPPPKPTSKKPKPPSHGMLSLFGSEDSET